MAGVYPQDLGEWALYPQEERKSDKSPDFGGNLSIACPHCRVAIVGRLVGWRREREGRRWLSGKVNPKQTPPPARDGEIPF